MLSNLLCIIHIMKITIPFEVLYILYIFKKANLSCYIVGGSVRDTLLNSNDKKIFDWDFTTNAKPEDIQSLFDNSFYENKFGCVSITHEDLITQINKFKSLPNSNLQIKLNQKDNKLTKQFINITQSTKIHESLEPVKIKQNIKTKVHAFEITTYRSKEIYKNFRQPTEIKWGKTINDDLLRRDFTINALAINIQFDYLTSIFEQDSSLKPSYLISQNNFELIDHFDGLKHLKQGLIKAIGDPDVRFNEDALRMLRAIRFSSQLQMKIDSTTLKAIKDNNTLLKHISAERIRDEIKKTIVTPQPSNALRIMDETKLLKHIMPELLTTKNIEQGGHHTMDVWNHILASLDNCPSSDPIVKLSSLLHDIGKPKAFAIKDGNITFYNHEVIGSRIAVDIAKRLKLSKKNRQRIFILVRYHMFFYQPNHTDAAVRRIIRKVGIKNLNDLLAIREGDRIGSGSKKTSWRFDELQDRMRDQLNQPLDIKDLAINGSDLINNLGLKPGPKFKYIFKQLLEEVLDNPEINTKEKLLTKAKKLLN